MATTRTVRGIPITVHNSRPDVDTEAVFARLDEALGLIERHVPHYFRHLRRDFRQILVQRYACRGAYLPDQDTCLVELTFSTNPNFSAAQVASTILHEAMHARLHRLGFPLAFPDRARQERFCRRAELEFGALVPDGAPILARALESLQGSDTDVAPLIDPVLAARRVAEVDQAARRGSADSRAD
jgi:hypothetical protein